ncbi:MAG: hypothetical protein QM811_10275 [Pirellulales bacterium]
MSELQGVGINAHGFGIALTIDDLKIDFDWGEQGQRDGFDAWRLYYHAMRNQPSTPCTHDDVFAWLRSAFDEELLTTDGRLFYDPRRRAVVK